MSTINRRVAVGWLVAPLGICIAAPNPLRVAIYGVKPFGFRNSSGVPEGIMVDWFHLLANEAKVEISVELAPAARTNRYLETGQVDLASFNSALAAPRGFIKLGTVGDVLIGFWARRDAKLQWGIASLRGKNVAALRGGSSEVLARNGKDISVQSVGNVAALVAMLRLRRVDAVVLSDLALRSYLAEAVDERFFNDFEQIDKVTISLDLYASESLDGHLKQVLRSACEKLHLLRRFEFLSSSYTKINPKAEVDRPPATN